MKLKDIGEREIIKILSNHLEGKAAVGIGDDCAAIQFGENFLLLTTDMVTEELHLPKEMSPWQIGWFIAAINLSDIAAKGGKPIGMLLSMGIPRSMEIDFLEEIAKGANELMKNYGGIIGGDTKESSQITISGMAMGIMKREEFIPRKGARVGDVVCVTGSLGKAGAGLYALKKNLPNKMEMAKELLEPIPRIKEGIALASAGCATSSMDISDGLASSLHQLREINGIGFEIHWEKLPISRNAKIGDEKEFVLYCGGDYELLVTIKPDKLKKAVKAIESVGGKLTPIGKVVREGIYLVDKSKKREIIENRGYEHFR